MEYIKVANSDEVTEKIAYKANINGINIALFRHNKELYAFKDSCPHQAAPLSDGYVQDDCLVCKYHDWKFKLKDGAFVNNITLKLISYPTKEKNGEIFINIDI